MKYKNVLIICKKEYGEELQKYLFKLGYYYFIKGKKDRHIIDNGHYDFCIIIKNDRSLAWRNQFFIEKVLTVYKNMYNDLEILNYPNCVRLDKLKKLKLVKNLENC